MSWLSGNLGAALGPTAHLPIVQGDETETVKLLRGSVDDLNRVTLSQRDELRSTYPDEPVFIAINR